MRAALLLIYGLKMLKCGLNFLILKDDLYSIFFFYPFKADSNIRKFDVLRGVILLDHAVRKT